MRKKFKDYFLSESIIVEQKLHS